MKNELKKIDRVKRQGWIMLLVFFLLTAVNIVFAVLCIDGTEIEFIVKYRALTTALAVLLFCIACGFCVWFTLADKETLQKSFLSGYVFVLFALVCIFVFQKTGFFRVVKNAESLQEYLEKVGAWMPILYIVLQYLQVVLLSIPSVVSTVAGLALFGSFRTMLYSLIGMLLGSLTAFFIGRKLGNKAVSWMVGEETLTKWQKKLKGKDNLFLTVMFVLPLFPDDVLCFIAGLSSMSNRYFLLMILLARIVGIAGTCYSFDYIPFDTWWGLLIWGVFFAAVITLFFLVYKNMDKIQAWFKNKKEKRKKDD